MAGMSMDKAEKQKLDEKIKEEMEQQG